MNTAPMGIMLDNRDTGVDRDFRINLYSCKLCSSWVLRMFLNRSGLEETPSMVLLLCGPGCLKNNSSFVTGSWFESQTENFQCLLHAYPEHEVRHWQGWLTQLGAYA